MAKQNVFGLNGKFYNVRILDFERSFQIADNDENAGRLISGDMERDIIGTYYNYSLKIEPNGRARIDYNELYDTISSPVNYVMLSLLINGQYQEFRAYVTNGKDKMRIVNGETRWTNLSVNFIAMSPQRRPA